jgi:uncharacterized protein with HEPN domain
MSIDRPILDRLNYAKNFAREAHQIALAASPRKMNLRDYQAILYCLMVVGEALNWVPADIPAREPSIRWRRVVALRHRLVHAYWPIDEDIIVEIARNETEEHIAAPQRLIDKAK